MNMKQDALYMRVTFSKIQRNNNKPFICYSCLWIKCKTIGTPMQSFALTLFVVPKC